MWGKRVTVTHDEDSSATGAAIIAMKALGIISNLHDVHSFFIEKEVFKPDMKNHEIYMQNYAIYAGLYDKLKI